MVKPWESTLLRPELASGSQNILWTCRPFSEQRTFCLSVVKRGEIPPCAKFTLLRPSIGVKCFEVCQMSRLNCTPIWYPNSGDVLWSWVAIPGARWRLWVTLEGNSYVKLLLEIKITIESYIVIKTYTALPWTTSVIDECTPVYTNSAHLYSISGSSTVPRYVWWERLHLAKC